MALVLMLQIAVPLEEAATKEEPMVEVGEETKEEEEDWDAPPRAGFLGGAAMDVDDDIVDDDVAAPEIRRKLVDAPEEEVSGGELLPAASACGAAAVRASCGLWAAPAPVRGASWRAGCVHRRR